MSLEYITNHLDLQLDKVVSQFKDKPELEKLISVLLAPLQDLESFINDVWTKVNLENASGEVLDLIGRIVGRSRGGFSDADYRNLLAIQIGVNTSKGNSQPLASIIKEVTNSTYVELQEFYPAAVTAIIDGDNLSSGLLSLLEQTVSAGVDLNLSSITTFPPFAFEGISPAGGMGTLYDANIGGHFVDRIEV